MPLTRHVRALALRNTQPFGGDRLRPLVRDELSASGLLLGADRTRGLTELRSHRHCLLDSRPLTDFFQPALHVGKLVDLDLPGRPARCPGIADHIGNRVFAGGEIPLVEQTEVHDPVDAVRLIVEAADGVGKIAVVPSLESTPKMALLAELGTLIGQLPADPLGDIIFFARFRWTKPSCLLGEVRHDGPRLEDGNRGAAAHRLVIDDRRHPAVWRDLQKVGGELVTAADIDRLDGVRKPSATSVRLRNRYAFVAAA
jgi:hypothetical protein